MFEKIIDRKNLFILIGMIILILILFYPLVFNGKVFGSPDSLSPRGANNILQQMNETDNQYPLWQPWIFSGMPTIHSFLNVSVNYYPHSIMIFLNNLGLPWMWNFLFHFILSGFGMYVLLKYLKQSRHAAIFGSIGYMIMPYMVVMTAYGHGSQIMSAAYIPWICWGLLKLWNKQNIQNLAILSILVGFQLQRGHIQIAYYTWLMIGIFILYKICTSRFVPQFYYYLMASLCSGFLMSISIICPS